MSQAFKSPDVLRPALSLLYHAYPADAALFHHAREYTIKNFDAASCSKFWNTFVLPLAHTTEPVKHALCALGGAHRRFLTRYQAYSTCSSSAAEYELVSIQKYNQAIEHMRPLMLENTEASLQTTLICCVIFISIESLHGRYNDAIRHLHAGCQLLNSLQGRINLKQGHLTQIHYEGTGSTAYNLFGMVAEMLLRLGQNVAVYEGSDTFFDLKLPPRVMNMGSSQQPFADLIEADTLLDHVGDIYDSFITDPRLQVVPVDGSSGSPCLLGPSIVERKMALSAARFAFSIWNSRYEATKATQRYQNSSFEEKQGLAFLDMHQAIWAALVKLETIEQDLSTDDCRLILQRASIIIDLEGNKASPVYAFNGYLIPALSIVCGSCQDVDVQRRGISLLRKLRRREGIWDSQEVADIYENMIAADEQNMVDWDTLPWGIPQLAAQLSALSLPGSKSSSPSSGVDGSQAEATFCSVG